MNFHIYNRELSVGSIRILGVSSSSIVLVGDSQTIQLGSAFDTPAESLIVGPFVPLASGG
ncbi:spore gernimation protein GerPD [Neobacillus notoginsengisoli]|uniref:Spore gernimation protein GerPD n=1 Tax=Neobacillus notoginsengisoli TaxID=1578198 RepID=A0A417YZ19_9BACI|nr:spore gernimation protein GerPD [Neobacillus notoginsengisoli]RHW43163.1 spore gernimation protein GerPD [Neobacillus notoginsengisoli]